MSKLLSLNELYDQYSAGLLEKRQFEGLLFESLLDKLCRYNVFGWKRDDCIDYLSWLYPRFSRAIDNYKNIGASFESYIGTLVRWSSREYYFHRENRNAEEYAAWTVRLPDMYVHGNEPDYPETDNAEGEVKAEKKQARNPRQLLILTLKCYYYLSDDFLERLAPRVGVDKEKLRAMIDTLRRQRIIHDEEIRLTQERIHSQYYRCIMYERRLRTLTENTDVWLRLKLKWEKARRRLEAMRNRYSRVRLEATNLQVARLLGVPKGTVDSSLHALKKRSKKGH